MDINQASSPGPARKRENTRVSYMSVNVRARNTDPRGGYQLGWLACCWRMGRNTGGGSLERRGAPQEKLVRGCNWKSCVVIKYMLAFVHEMVDYHSASAITGLDYWTLISMH